MLHAVAPTVAAASVDLFEEKGAAMETVIEDEAASHEELQRALEASLQSYEEDQLRQVMEETEPKAWTHALPQAFASETAQSQAAAKDAFDTPVTLRTLRAQEKYTGLPPSKRARHTWNQDCSKIFASADPRSLTEMEAAELWQVLFSPSADEGDVERWLRSSFAFVRGGRDDSSSIRSAKSTAWACPWGLRQELGGPCGVLAAVQGFIVHALLWGAAEDCADESLSQVSTAAGAESDAELSTAASSSMPSPDRGAADSGTDTEVPASPCDAGPGATWSTSPDGESSVVAAALVDRLAERFEKVDQQELLVCALARILYAAAPTSRYYWAEVSSQHDVIINEFVTIQALADWLVASGVLESACPVLSFVYSLVITRGIEALRHDMDDASTPLVGVFGHCAQELVNLCLTGRAVTNVFDGNVTFQDGSDVLTLQGIQERPLVGFLSTLEPLKYLQVGKFLKQPRYPLWVAASDSHYSLFFAGDCLINHLATADEAATAETTRFCCACFGGSCENEPATCISATLLHFNGKDFGADRPELTAMSIRTVDPQERSNSGPQPVGVDDSQLFAEVLRSRWPGAEVSCLQVSGSSEAASPPRLH